MKLEFVHVPRDDLNIIPSIFSIPIGTFALAELLSRQKFEVRITHLGIERILDPGFDYGVYFDKADVFLIPLHWHYQSYSVIKFIKKIKKLFPKSIIVTGGFTASFFGKELMEYCKSIDFLSRGDSEKPLLKLIKALEQGKHDFSGIPNLIWRKNNQIIDNGIAYTIDAETIDDLIHLEYGLLNHYEKYLSSQVYAPLEQIFRRDKGFIYNPGRGCGVSCPYCGGGAIAQKHINNRNRPLFISHKSVLRDLEYMRKYDADEWWISFDPIGDSSEYYSSLFEKMHERKLAFKVLYEAWGLPNNNFLLAVHKYLPDNSVIILSPDTGSERVRRYNKGFYFSNQQLFECMDLMDRLGIKYTLNYTIGLPMETPDDFNETLNLMQLAAKKGKNLFNQAITPIEIEPGAPVFMSKNKYGIITKRSEFKDFIESSKTYPSPGYSTQHMTEQQILELAKLANSLLETMNTG